MIYAIRANGTPYIKFGYTSEINVRDRLGQLQTGCPYELEMVAVGMGGALEEAEIHATLEIAGKRHRGEWFIHSEATKAAIQWILDRKKPLPPIPPMKPGRKRLERVMEYAKTIKLERHTRKAKPPRLPRDLQIYQHPNSPQSSIAPSKSTEQASQFMQSLISWESSTLRSTANSLSTESQNGETLRSEER